MPHKFGLWGFISCYCLPVTNSLICSSKTFNDRIILKKKANGREKQGFVKHDGGLLCDPRELLQEVKIVFKNGK